MKLLFYKLYAIIFNIAALFSRIDENLVALVSMHNENFNDSLGAVYDVLKTDGKYKFLFVSKQDLSMSNPFKVIKFFFIQPLKLAKAKYIFLNDNFLPMGGLKIKSGVKVVQLWHGEGAFKKFGFAIPQPEDVRKNEELSNSRLTHVVCSSKAVVPIYAQAFGVEESQVLPLGSPRTDYLFNPENEQTARDNLEKQYPAIKGKKLVLYAPTFRGDEKQDSEILDHLDVDLFNRVLGDEYVLAFRLHPQIHSAAEKLCKVINLTDYPDMRQLTLAADICVTDYSSICMNFSMIDKKCVFYAYDLDYYKGSRDFYFDYESYVPGGIVKTMPELLEAIKAPMDTEKNNKFKNINFNHFDGMSGQRVVDCIVDK